MDREELAEIIREAGGGQIDLKNTATKIAQHLLDNYEVSIKPKVKLGVENEISEAARKGFYSA